MVGFLRKKKSDRAVLSGGTVLDRKGKVDNARSLYDVNGKRVNHNQRSSDEENHQNPMNNAGYPPMPPPMPAAATKKSRFRIPGMGKKN
ncbi:hypothetical protein GQ600_21318 [Phytophthora cactorum]|nr:hypothetical protein GQ600_21318 [Phytophthora cactorum]